MSEDERLNTLEAEVSKLKDTIEALTARIETLEGVDDEPEPEKKSKASKSKGSKAKDKKKNASSKKKKAEKSAKKNAKKAEDNKKTRVKHQKSDFYYVVGKKIYVEVPEPFKFGTKHKTGPAVKLSLDYAYGYNGSIRDNMCEGDQGEVCYVLAGAAVAVNPTDFSQQRFFTGHNEDVTCIARNPACNIIATGQRDPKGEGTPFVCLWDCSLGEKIMPERGRIVKFFYRSVATVGFTNDGKFIFAVGCDDSQIGGVFNVEKICSNTGGPIELKKALVSKGVSKDEVYGQAHASDMIDGAYNWVTYGAKIVKWWTYTPGQDSASFTPKVLGSLSETKITQKGYNCAAFTPDGDVLVGCPTGHIYHFNRHSKALSHYFDTGKAPINAIIPQPDVEGHYHAIDSKGTVYTYNWAENGGKKTEHKLEKTVKVKVSGKITTAQKIGDSTFIGTTLGQLSVSDLNVDEPDAKELMSGWTKEIWGLAAHPTQKWIAVGADDKILRIWDYEAKTCILKHKAKSGIRTADFSRDGNLLILGAINGSVIIMDVEDGSDDFGTAIYDKKICDEEVSAVCFAKDGTKAIIGSWDQTLRIIEKKKETWKVNKKRLKGHTSSITHVCLSEDGLLARSCSKDVETLFWDVEAGKRLDYVEADTIWDRWNCVLGWPVQGLYFDAEDATDVNCCEISGGNEIDDEKGMKVVASGDDTGHVTIFKYPILEQKPKHKDQYLVHSAHVTNVRFAEDDQYLFSIGGGDLACFQWAVSAK